MARYRFYGKRSPFTSRIVDICCFLLVALAISIASLYFTNKEFAVELRQVRQPKPNVFCVGIDVSQTIRPDILADFKDALISRLKSFIGDKKVSYHISVFGLPGCGEETMADIVSMQSPEDPLTFSRQVERRIEEIYLAGRRGGDEDMTPLTTPLHCFLDKMLRERAGERVIVFSDLVNDDTGCRRHYSFPLRAIEEFGNHKGGEIVFLYPTPYVGGKYDTPEVRERLITEQKNFIMEMQKLTGRGKVRAFFYHVPAYREKRIHMLRSQLQRSIPATMVEVIWERVSKMIDTIIGAVRG